MAKRGVAVTYETIRDWSQTFGATYAQRLRSRAQRPGDRWHIDEVYLSINGKLQYLWRAVDQDGEVLDDRKRANNLAESSHQPTRERERRMRGFKSPAHAQRFLATFGVIASFFRPGRHLFAARNYREVMRRRFAEWAEVIHPGFTAR